MPVFGLITAPLYCIALYSRDSWTSQGCINTTIGSCGRKLYSTKYGTESIQSWCCHFERCMVTMRREHSLFPPLQDATAYMSALSFAPPLCSYCFIWELFVISMDCMCKCGHWFWPRPPVGAFCLDYLSQDKDLSSFYCGLAVCWEVHIPHCRETLSQTGICSRD